MEAWELDSRIDTTETELCLVSEKLNTVVHVSEDKDLHGKLMRRVNDILDNMSEILEHISAVESKPTPEAGDKLKNIYNHINIILQKMTVLKRYGYFALKN